MTTMLRCLVALAALLALGAGGCADPASDDVDDNTDPTDPGGKGDNSVQQPVLTNSPFAWAVTTQEEFARAAQAPPFRVHAPLPATDPITTRLQTWADAYHAALAKKVPKLAAPRPQVLVRPARNAGAWVSSVPVCLVGPVDVEIAGPGATAEREFVLIKHDEVIQLESFMGAPAPKCVRPTNWAPGADPVAWFNSLGGHCRLEQRGARYAIVGASCRAGANLTAGKATWAALYVPSIYIQFTSQMIAMAEREEAIVGVLAHELGHYYRTHGITDLVSDRYNYWYQVPHPPRAWTPPRQADSDALNATLHDLLPYPKPAVDGQRYSYELTHFLTDDLAPRLPASPGACTRVRDGLDWEWTGAFSPLGPGYATPPQAAAYLAWETELAACAADVQVADDVPGALSYSDLMATVRVALGDLAEPAPAPGTLAAILEALDGRGRVREAELAAFLATLHQRDLGYYTAEQEAEEFSVVWFSRIGLNPNLRVAGSFELIRARAATDPAAFTARNGIDFATCERYYRSGWTAGVPPMGDLLDPHHGDCYRLWLMSQEIVAHRLKAAAVAVPSFTAPWSEVVEQAAAVTAGVYVPPPSYTPAPPLSEADLAALRSGAPVVDTF